MGPFLQLPFQAATHNLQQTAFLTNTVVLIVALIVVELVYSEQPPAKRRHLKYFYPLFMVLAGLLIYAAYSQSGRA
jgi:uncharacterized membrane protein